MLDIDLDFLTFLLNPSCNYLADEIKLIEESYLSKTDNNLIEEKRKIFDNSIYVFANDIGELRSFIKEFSKNLIEEVYIKFGDFFNISLKDEPSNNFIRTILLNNNINSLSGDTKLKVLKNDIRNYLIDIINNSSNTAYKDLAQNALVYLDKLIKKYDSIYEVLMPYITMLENEEEKRKKITTKILKKIMIKNKHLLDENEYSIITSSNTYEDINNIFSNKFSTFFKNIYDYNNDDFILDISDTVESIAFNTKDSEEKLKTLNISYKNMYTGKEAISQMIIDAQKYNAIYNRLWKYNRKVFFTSQLKSQLKKFIDSETINNKLANAFFESLNNNKKGHAFSCSMNFTSKNENISVSFQVCKPLKNIRFINNELGSLMFFLICHEIKHIYDSKTSCISKDIFNLIFEPYSDFVATNKMLELINSGFLTKGNIKNIILDTAYSDTNFILLDLFENYQEYFEQCLAQGNTYPLIELMGENIFKKLIYSLENFNLEKAKTTDNSQYGEGYLKYADKLLNEIETYQLRKKKRTI